MLEYTPVAVNRLAGLVRSCVGGRPPPRGPIGRGSKSLRKSNLWGSACISWKWKSLIKCDVQTMSPWHIHSQRKKSNLGLKWSGEFLFYVFYSFEICVLDLYFLCALVLYFYEFWMNEWFCLEGQIVMWSLTNPQFCMHGTCTGQTKPLLENLWESSKKHVRDRQSHSLEAAFTASKSPLSSKDFFCNSQTPKVHWV